MSTRAHVDTCQRLPMRSSPACGIIRERPSSSSCRSWFIVLAKARSFRAIPGIWQRGDGTRVSLAEWQATVLRVLLKSPDCWVQHEMLEKAAGVDPAKDNLSQKLDRLEQKFDFRIENKKGIGYRLLDDVHEDFVDSDLKRPGKEDPRTIFWDQRQPSALWRQSLVPVPGRLDDFVQSGMLGSPVE